MEDSSHNSLPHDGEASTPLRTDDLDYTIANSTIDGFPNSSNEHSIASETILCDLPTMTRTRNPLENSEASGTEESTGREDDSNTPPHDESVEGPTKESLAFHFYITTIYNSNSTHSKRTSQSSSFDLNDNPHSGRRVCNMLNVIASCPFGSWRDSTRVENEHEVDAVSWKWWIIRSNKSRWKGSKESGERGR